MTAIFPGDVLLRALAVAIVFALVHANMRLIREEAA